MTSSARSVLFAVSGGNVVVPRFLPHLTLCRARCHCLATTALLGASNGDGMASHLLRCGAKSSLDVLAVGLGDAATPQAGSAGAGARLSLEEGRFPVLSAL